MQYSTVDHDHGRHLYGGGDADVKELGEEGMGDAWIGVMLAASSSVFIGTSFIVKKKGLRKAGASGVRAGSGGYSYLKEPLWWMGLLCMVLGEGANFMAYAFAPAILVTPLGALSILVRWVCCDVIRRVNVRMNGKGERFCLVFYLGIGARLLLLVFLAAMDNLFMTLYCSAVLAHILLNEKLNMFGIVGCILCITGTLSIVLHAPEEQQVTSVVELWMLAMHPHVLLYIIVALVGTWFLIWRVPYEVQSSNVLVYIGICSIVGSLSVVSCKALGIALKLTFEGKNQLIYPQTYFFLAVVIIAVMTQMNYLNKALDLFNTAIVTPIYYVMFTTLTIVASAIMFPEVQMAKDMLTELSGFLTIICGTFLLHATKDLDVLPLSRAISSSMTAHRSPGGVPLQGTDLEMMHVMKK